MWLGLPPPVLGRGVGGEGAMSLLDQAKHLRTHQTEAERRLWYCLRAHSFLGLKFKRQQPIGCYIVDFICHERWLIAEVDGGQHAIQAEYDHRGDTYLRDQGYRVLRFWNHEVMHQLDGVLERIRLAVLSQSPSPPAPPPQAGEG